MTQISSNHVRWCAPTAPLGTTNSVGHSDDSRAVALLMSTYERVNYEGVWIPPTARTNTEE